MAKNLLQLTEHAIAQRQRATREYKAFDPTPVQGPGLPQSLNVGRYTLGTCSKCGGPVTVPAIWTGQTPPVPTCQGCGAVPRQPHGPVIEME